MMKISIVTATYNRELLLQRLYESICENSMEYPDIEWLIMDDGSEKNIQTLIEGWQKQASFPIFLYRQKNQGKMAAINALIPSITGEILIEMDDDDYFVPHCFQMIASDFEKIKNDEDIYGVIYEKDLSRGNGKIDKSFDQKVMRLYDLHYQKKADFDMSLVFKSDYRKQFSYELEHQEKFVTEARMYYKMDQKKRGFLIHAEKIMICEYQEEGYSKNQINLFRKNPYGYYAFFSEVFTYPQKNILWSKRLYNIKHFILFGFLTGKKYKEMKNIPKGINRLLFTILYFPGMWLSKKRFGDSL